MRILYFCLRVDANSQSLHFVLDWIRAVADHEKVAAVDVVTMYEGKASLPECVKVYSVGKELGYSEPRRAWEFYRMLFGLLRQNDYSGCFAHMMPLFALMGAPLLKWKRIPVVLWYAHSSVTLVLRGANRVVDAVFTPSEASYRLSARRKVITGHGLLTESLPGFSPQLRASEFRIVTVSRLARVKNIDLILAAFARYVPSSGDKECRLRVVGASEDGSLEYARELEGLAERLGCYEQVDFLGSLDTQGVFHECQRASVFVSASATGSIDKAVLESMACGVPVLAPPCYEEVLPEELRCLIHDGTSEGLAHKIAWYRDHGCELAGEQWVEIVRKDHSLQNVVSRLIRFFE